MVATPGFKNCRMGFSTATTTAARVTATMYVLCGGQLFSPLGSYLLLFALICSYFIFNNVPVNTGTLFSSY